MVAGAATTLGLYLIGSLGRSRWRDCSSWLYLPRTPTSGPRGASGRITSSASTRASGACSRRWWPGIVGSLAVAAPRSRPGLAPLRSPAPRRAGARDARPAPRARPARAVIEPSARLATHRPPEHPANEGRHHGPDRGRRPDARVEHVRLVADRRGGIRGRRAGDGPVDRDALGGGPSRGRGLLRGGARSSASRPSPR